VPRGEVDTFRSTSAACDRNIPAAECLYDHIRPHLTGAKRIEPDSADFSVAFDAICPAHDDDHGSMRVSVGRTRITLKCYAGCDELAIRDGLIRFGVTPRCLPLTQQRKADLVEQLLGVVTDPDLEHGHKVLLVAAFLRGMGGLPRGGELADLAASVGLSRSRAFDYKRETGQTRTSGRYGADGAPVKQRRSSRSVAPLEKSDGRTKSDSRTEKSPMVGLNDKNRRPAA
jgi:hypothetical protein